MVTKFVSFLAFTTIVMMLCFYNQKKFIFTYLHSYLFKGQNKRTLKKI